MGSENYFWKKPIFGLTHLSGIDQQVYALHIIRTSLVHRTVVRPAESGSTVRLYNLRGRRRENGGVPVAGTTVSPHDTFFLQPRGHKRYFSGLL